MKRVRRALGKLFPLGPHNRTVVDLAASYSASQDQIDVDQKDVYVLEPLGI